MNHQNASQIIAWLDENQAGFIDLAEQIWQTPEITWREFKASRLQADFLAKEGFDIAWDTGGLNTAFVAEWGNGGGPTLAFIGEYDALPGLSQTKCPFKESITEGGAGHGCGHNLLGSGAVASAVAVQKWLQKTGVAGTVRYYGCPAEEEGGGKVFMARAGVFDDLDAAFTFHPGSLNMPSKGSSLGINSIFYRFHGRSAHASIAPHEGRSALDGVELMNIGANYLREHVTGDVRIHYVITNGGEAPNIVPTEAEVHYYIRAAKKDYLAKVVERIRNVAEGAALMTGTAVEIRFEDGYSPIINNHYLADMQYRAMKLIGRIDFTADETAFAQKINDAFSGTNAEYLEQQISTFSVPPQEQARLNEYRDQPLIGENFPALDAGVVMPGSTDVGDLSQIVPLSMLIAACWPTGTPGHSWANVAASGISMGYKGMLHAAGVMAVTAQEIYMNPGHLTEIRNEFNASIGDNPYIPPIPDTVSPQQYTPTENQQPEY